MIHTGDCLDVMATFDAESIDAIVTDPPYDLLSASRNGSRRTPPANAAANPFSRHDRGGQAGGFMGKAWDGTGVAFRRETWEAAYRVAKPSAYLLAFGGTRTVHRMTVALEDAGWIIRDMLVWAYASGFPKSKASLKPAWEPIVMARKPGPLRMLAIDACRIPTEPDDTTLGRWPANVILTDPIFDGGWDGVVGGGMASAGAAWEERERGDGRGILEGQTQTGRIALEPTTYSRFFLIPKADRSDREPVLGGLPTEVRTMNSGLTGVSGDRSGRGGKAEPLEMGAAKRANHHPTVKPVDLMRHLVRLVTPAGGTVLDPFLGSGTTGLAAEMEGFPWIGIEKEPEYVAIAEARLNGTQRGLGLVG